MTPPAASHAQKREADDIKLTIFGQSLEVSGKIARMAWPWIAICMGVAGLVWALLGPPAKINERLDKMETSISNIERDQTFIKEIITRRRNR